MKEQAVVRLLRLLGARNITTGGDWVKASCPFTPYPNSGHKGDDEHPSFGVSTDKRSSYHCYGCQRSGPLATLVTALCFLSGKDNIKARQLVMSQEDHTLEDYEQVEAEREPLKIVPNSVLTKFAPVTEKFEYMKKRGITDAAIKHWHLRYDLTRRRVIFPVRDEQGGLLTVRGRTVCDALPKMREYPEIIKQSPKKHGIWFGQQFVPPEGKKIILVEGEIDAIALWQALQRPGIWAAMGASVSREQIRTLTAHYKHQFVLFFDNDAAGVTATKKVLKEMVGTVSGIWVVRNYVGGHDPDEIVRAGKLREALESLEKMG